MRVPLKVSYAYAYSRLATDANRLTRVYLIQVNLRLNSVVQNSPVAQYILEADISGNIPCHSSIPLASKLHFLRSCETRRRQLTYRTVETPGFPRPGGSYWRCTLRYCGLFTDISWLEAQNQTEIGFWKLPTQFDPAPIRRSVFKLDFLSETSAFNPELNFFVVVRRIAQ